LWKTPFCDSIINNATPPPPPHTHTQKPEYLPRQARDKHRKRVENNGAFLQDAISDPVLKHNEQVWDAAVECGAKNACCFCDAILY
jgi:hypothetical protein